MRRLPTSHHLLMASDNCAIGPDGKLLDASKITWFNDPDDAEPMAPASSTSSAVQRQPSVNTLDAFVTRDPPPAARRSARAPRPSTKVIDPDNIMAIKCKSSNTVADNPAWRLRQASPELEDDNSVTEPDPTGTDTEDDGSVDPDHAYEDTKALGDADRAVCVHCSSQTFL